MKNIGVLLVTYNRPKDLNVCLKSIENQSYKPKIICIVDNASSDETLNLLEERNILNTLDIEKIKKEKFNFLLENMPCYLKIHKKNNIHHIYLRLKENVGGSGGFYYGLKYLHENTDLDGYYILDDDAILDENCLKNIVPFTNEYLSITSLKIDKNNSNFIIPHIGYCVNNNYKYFPVKTIRKVNNNLEISFSSFVGWYFDRKLIEKVGYPRKDFFIRSDDTEFSFRIKFSGIKTLLVSNSKIYHPSGIENKLPLFKYFFDFRNLSYIYRYYFIENKKIKEKILKKAHKIFFKFVKIRFGFNLDLDLDLKKFYNLMYEEDNKNILNYLKQFNLNTNFSINEDFIVFSSNSYLNITNLHKHPYFKGVVYFEKRNKIFNISFDNIIKTLEENKNLKILLEARSIFIYKLIGHFVSKNKEYLIDRIVV